MIEDVTLENLPLFADKFWTAVGDKTVFLFYGEMGAGKTTTINALCKAKGVTEPTSSPTFSIINEYSFEEKGQQKSLFHIDLYRLKSIEEAIAAGVEECIYSGAPCFIEWPEKAPELFDETALHITITPLTETVRRIHILPAV